MRANDFLESININDNFDIEFDDFVIESRVIGFTEDGVIIEGDDKALALLGVSGALLESVKVNEIAPAIAALAAAGRLTLPYIIRGGKKIYDFAKYGFKNPVKTVAGTTGLGVGADNVIDTAKKTVGIKSSDPQPETEPETKPARGGLGFGTNDSSNSSRSRGIGFEEKMAEAEYHGRKVQLNKPMRGDVKKSKVYVKNKKGNVIKVNFGDPNMKIKKSNPARRKSFRARHRCDTAKDKTTARYWSCRAW